MTDEQKERNRQRERVRYQKNPEPAKARSKASAARRTQTYYSLHKAERLAYQKARYRSASAALQEYQKRYRAENPEAESARGKAWKSTHPDRVRAMGRAAYHKHVAKRSVKNKTYREANREKVAVVKRAWAAANPLNRRQSQAKRRAIKRATKTGGVNLRKILLDSNGLCGICKQPLDLFGIDFDHIIPLSRGGSHTSDNIQATHSRCNRSKGAKLPEEMVS